MYYTVYKITNTLNGKVYIGTHITANLADGYWGSGKLITRAIRKYGVAAFTKEILHVYDNLHDMFAKEAELVNEAFVADKNTYNLKVGGTGGWDYVNKNSLNWSYEKNNKISGFKNAQPEDVAKWTEIGQAALNNFWTKVKSGSVPAPHNPRFTGKSHTEESKRRTGDANSKYQKGEGNSQFGKCWITDGKTNMKIRKDQAATNMPDGYRLGRVILKTR